MSNALARIKLDLSPMDKLDRNLNRELEGVVEQAAYDMVDYIQENWSDSSPSQEGSPPASRNAGTSGFLADRVYVKTDKFRGIGGRFVSSNQAISATVVADTEYAAALEYGHFYTNGRYLAPRPFMRPALLWLAQDYPKRFTSVIYHAAGLSKAGGREDFDYDDNGARNFNMNAGSFNAYSMLGGAG